MFFFGDLRFMYVEISICTECTFGSATYCNATQNTIEDFLLLFFSNNIKI